MGNTRRLIAVGACLGFGSLALAGTANRQAGLWEYTTSMTWQEAPQVPQAQGDKLKGGTHVAQYCLTQEMIDDYGVLLPQSRGQCSVKNRAIASGKVTADYICTGTMTGKGLLESSWIDAEHGTSKVHFSGTFNVGGELQPIEWTSETHAAFKSASCGSVKPLPMPAPAPKQ